MSHFKRDHNIDNSKWQDIIETVAEVLYEDGSLTETERYIVIDMLEDASARFINLSPESRAIFDRHDHLPANVPSGSVVVAVLTISSNTISDCIPPQ